MKRIRVPSAFLLLAAVVLLCCPAQAQQASPGITAASSAQAVSPNLISFSDTLPGQPDGPVTVTFALYPDQQSTTAAWTETQVVQVTQGKYTALLGSASSEGIPPDAFAADQAHWLGVQINGAEKRYLLVSVPYAMKAMEAERLGGLLPSDYVTLAQLQSVLQNAAGPSSSTATGGGKTVSATPLAAASGTPPQPATDFTDNNTSEVLLVTQQGTGFAIHAVSAGDAALFAENSTATGTALKALASSATGNTTGILGQSASPDGIAGVFDNTANGKILSLRNNGNEMVSVNQRGDINTLGFVLASGVAGDGSGLFNIPNSATTATTASTGNTIVLRDNSGGITANNITANVISGNGIGLFNIPNSATTATAADTPNTIVQRDNGGGISVSQMTANFISGNGGGLFNIPNSATTATAGPTANTIVLRDNAGGISANQITGSLIFGNGAGLFNIPNSATTATSGSTPNTIALRDANGLTGFDSVQINTLATFTAMVSNGSTDFTRAISTAPVKAVDSTHIPTSCFADRDLLIQTDAPAGQKLFVCNDAGNGWILLGDGTAAGVTSVGAGDASVTVGGTAAAPTVAVANGGITSAKLAPNAVAGSIADSSLTPAKIAGTAAILGSSNIFSGNQTILGSLTANSGLSTLGTINAAGEVITGNTGGTLATITQNGNGTSLSATNFSNNATVVASNAGTGHGLDASSNGGIAINASGSTGIGVVANGNLALLANGGAGGTAAVFTGAPGTKLLSGQIVQQGGGEVFSVDSGGNIFSTGAISSHYVNNPLNSTHPNQLVKLLGGGTVALAGPGDTAFGIAVGNPDSSGNVQVAYAGVVSCLFDNIGQPSDYVVVSNATAGDCSDAGPVYPSTGQVLGRLLDGSIQSNATLPILLFGSEQHAFPGGSVSTVNTGAGLTGGPITSSGTISIANAGVTNAMLQNNSVTVNTGAGLAGGGLVPLGGSVTLSNAGTLSFNGRTGNVLPAPGDYSFNQLSGSVNPSQLPTTTAYTDQSNFFSVDQTINGKLTTNSLAAGSLSGASGSFSGSSNANQFQPVLSVTDAATAGGVAAIFATSQDSPAAVFTSLGPTILMAGTATGGVFSVSPTGVTVFGTASATAFSGDGSALTNVNASSIGGTTLANLATTSALASEATARQSADAALATSVSAETAARQSDVGNLQTSINNVSAADAKLAASNTFTAGTQDFSGAGATLPVRALPSAQTPATCIASKELLIKTDAPAGQQLFLCDAGGSTWNLVGDGASGGVTSFNGRNGTVSPSSGDYSFSQISGSLAASQLPALTGDVTEAAGSGVTLLTTTGVTPGAYSKVSVDLKGRVVSGSQAAFSDLTGSAAQSQLPVNVVYNNQVNTFSASQAVNGSLSATFFTGNGGGLSNVNAATLNNLASTSFAQLGTNNTFTGSVTASSFSGDGSGLTGVNAATVNSLQMLKLTASITPSNVNAQTCNEQSFTVSGVNSGDALLGVQNTTRSPGTNIAIGGWRVSAANTVAIQFCNVSRSNSTPATGTYTFALMR